MHVQHKDLVRYAIVDFVQHLVIVLTFWAKMLIDLKFAFDVRFGKAPNKGC